MSYFATTAIKHADSPSIDAFGRLRTSFPFTIFDSKLIYDKQPLSWAEKITGAGATSTYNTNQASVTLSVPLNTVSSVIRQTKRRFNYQPGHSQLLLFTGVIGAATSNITKRIGYFDDQNGLFFEMIGSGIGVVKRTFTSGSAVDTRVVQASWNLDKMDGTGPSGVTLNFTQTQIMVVDFEWLGVGRVRMGWNINGITYYCHQFNHANSQSLVYMSTPNLPVRYEISNNGSGVATSLIGICCAVMSEGGQEATGPIFSADRGASIFTTSNTTNVQPILSIRPKSTRLGATITILNVEVMTTTATAFRWGLRLNPTIAGSDAASWVSDANSCIEYDISRTNANTLSGGTLIASGYVSNQSRSISVPGNNTVSLGSDIDGVVDQLVLNVYSVPSQAASYYGEITWREQY